MLFIWSENFITIPYFVLYASLQLPHSQYFDPNLVFLTVCKSILAPVLSFTRESNHQERPFVVALSANLDVQYHPLNV